MGRHACAIQGNVGNPESVEEIFAEFRQHFSFFAPRELDVHCH